jgi:hypothetical protein
LGIVKALKFLFVIPDEDAAPPARCIEIQIAPRTNGGRHVGDVHTHYLGVT